MVNSSFLSWMGFFWGGLLINKVRKTSSVYLKYMNISCFLPLGGAKMLQNHWKRCHWLLTQSKAQSPTAHDLSEPREKWLWHRLMTHVGYTSECIKTDTRDKSRIKESHPLGEYAECQSHMGNLSEGFFLQKLFGDVKDTMRSRTAFSPANKKAYMWTWQMSSEYQTPCYQQIDVSCGNVTAVNIEYFNHQTLNLTQQNFPTDGTDCWMSLLYAQLH